MNDIKGQIKHDIARGNLDEAFEKAQNHITDGQLNNSIILLLGQYSALKQQKNAGTIDYQAEGRERARIAQSLMAYVDEWQPHGEYDALRRAVHRLNIDGSEEINDCHLFNCNRHKSKRIFRKAFDAKNEEARRFQFYFICADENEMPHSLARRFVLEQIMYEELGDLNGNRIHFVPMENKDGKTPGRIKAEKLPSGSSLLKSIEEFKKYVQNRFSFANSDSFEVFMETGVPKLPYQYVAGVFNITESQWEDTDEWHPQKGSEQRQYFEWMIDRFRCAHTEIPTFVFFFVIHLKNALHEESLKPKQRAILEELKLIASCAEAAIFKEILPVEEADLVEWLSDLGDRNPNTVQNVVSSLVAQLKPHEKQLYENEQRIHMKDIEPVQRMVYDIAKK